MSNITVLSRTQRIIVDPATSSVSVINAGPPGPPGGGGAGSGALKYTTTIGDGVSSSHVVTHGLGTKLHDVTVYETGGTFRQVTCEVQHTSDNTITVLTPSIPAAGAYTVVVLG